ncbi:MAG: AIPR family protein [Coriobacteriia bacterium]|nr:AIPR family protein [Coriobacteriia bacterium]
MPKAVTPEEMFKLIEAAFTACEPEVSVPARAPLYWMLRYVFGLEEIEAQDAICDGANDKGIDAIHVDESEKVVYVLQSKRREKYGTSLGDSDLKHLVGTLGQLATPEGAELLASSGNAELAQLIIRHDLASRLQEDYSVRGVLVTNLPEDSQARTYLKTQVRSGMSLDLWDLERLYKALRHIVGSEYVEGPAYLHFTKKGSFSYSLSDSVEIIVALVPAKDIAGLPGIEDDTLFDHNVRGPLGNTRINKDIQRTIKDVGEHPLFPAYHNGMTIICKKLKRGRGRLELRDLSIVNGCQSAKTIAGNKSSLTDDLMVLVKIVNADPEASPLAYELTNKITQRSNNQNAITMRDLRSTDAKQRELSDEFQALFGSKVTYDIRRGEKDKAEIVIPNDLAAQELVSLYLEEPWDGHKKTELFEKKYDAVFSTSVHAQQVYFAHMFYEAAIANRDAIEDPSVASYQLTAFVLMYLARLILDQDVASRDLILEPLPIVTNSKKSMAVRTTLAQLLRSVAIDLNFYIKDERKKDQFWDYRRAFKRKIDVVALGDDVVKSYQKEIARDPSRAISL